MPTPQRMNSFQAASMAAGVPWTATISTLASVAVSIATERLATTDRDDQLQSRLTELGQQVQDSWSTKDKRWDRLAVRMGRDRTELQRQLINAAPAIKDDVTPESVLAREVYFRALEDLARPRAGNFLFGDQPSIADVCLVPQMYNARRFGVPVEEFELLRAIDERANSLPAFANAHPEAIARQEAQP